MSTSIFSPELEQLRAEFPGVDLAFEFDAARRKYGRLPSLGFLRLHWLPRCRPSRRRKPSQADREAEARRQTWLLATSLASPDGWAGWFASSYPALPPVAWADCPLDIRQRFARARLAADQSPVSLRREPRSAEEKFAGGGDGALLFDQGGIEKSKTPLPRDRACHHFFIPTLQKFSP